MCTCVHMCIHVYICTHMNIHVLKLFEPFFETAAEIANLHLKPKKCVAVPTSAVLDDSLRRCIATWLQDHIPAWRDFNIASCGKYLGFHLGPSSSEKQWVAPSAKWRLRAKEIASSHCPSSAAALTYNTRAVPHMGYVAQLALLPTRLVRRSAASSRLACTLPPIHLTTVQSSIFRGLVGRQSHR